MIQNKDQYAYSSDPAMFMVYAENIRYQAVCLRQTSDQSGFAHLPDPCANAVALPVPEELTRTGKYYFGAGAAYDRCG